MVRNNLPSRQKLLHKDVLCKSARCHARGFNCQSDVTRRILFKNRCNTFLWNTLVTVGYVMSSTIVEHFPHFDLNMDDLINKQLIILSPYTYLIMLYISLADFSNFFKKKLCSFYFWWQWCTEMNITKLDVPKNECNYLVCMHEDSWIDHLANFV